MEPGTPQARAEADATLRAAVELFNAGRYLAAHELFEELWEASEGADSDLFKGLIQAAIALHHLEHGNLEGAARLYSGHRRCLAGYLPTHRGLEVAGFLADMQAFLGPLLRPGPPDGPARAPAAPRPLLHFVAPA
jgi:hypothetical protein